MDYKLAYNVIQNKTKKNFPLFAVSFVAVWLSVDWREVVFCVSHSDRKRPTNASKG